MASTLQILGVYSPKANRAEYEAFLDREVAAHNPMNFSEDFKAFLIQKGRGDEIAAPSEEELRDIRDDIDREFSNAVLVELSVAYPDSAFSVDAFVQPNPNLPASQWQVPWLERFLTADGTALLDKLPHGTLPHETHYRVVFYIHEWKHEYGLNGPYGTMALPAVQPMPARLWQLAPYERVD